MKMNIKGLVFVGFAAAVFASAANAANDKIVTSKTYVDTKYIGDDTTITVTDGTGANTGKKVIAVTGDLTPYTAGANVQINDHEISATDTTYNAFDGTANGLVPATGAAADKVLSGDGSWVTVDGTPYTAGTNIQINDHEISATDTTYTADGTTVTLTGTQFSANTTGGVADGGTNLTTGDQVYDFVIDQVADGYVAGTNVQITDGTGVNEGKKVVSATDTTYTAGTGLTLTGTEFSVNGDITPYTAGTNVQINGHEISATDTTYTADGTTVTLTGTQFSANTTGGVADGGTNLTTGDQVYDFVTGLMPATVPSTCTAAAPCALVFAGGATPTWEPIQQ